MSLAEPVRALPKFDWTINLGHVLTIAAVLAALGTAYTTYQVTINDHDGRLRALERQDSAQMGRANEVTSALYSIKQDLAIIKYRLDRNGKVGETK